jgi:hypothetical protein
MVVAAILCSFPFFSTHSKASVDVCTTHHRVMSQLLETKLKSQLEINT